MLEFIGQNQKVSESLVEPIDTAIKRLQIEINEADWRGDEVVFLKQRLEGMILKKKNGCRFNINF
jgi:hypothetical protein